MDTIIREHDDLPACPAPACPANTEMPDAESPGAWDDRRKWRAHLAAAAFFAGAIAVVNPAIADECTSMAELLRAAAGDDTLSRQDMRDVERTIEEAMAEQALGNQQACLSHFTLARQTLRVA